ncbi:alpha/beta hydrolase [Halobellus captivus]|uniref:alpha/beta hydrolase n=1 Tax=Halobellus captivus TaxID=2592614 RepID=UPI0011A8E3E6|nr:alpha/beta hydrolase [Halobellus captivus]
MLAALADAVGIDVRRGVSFATPASEGDATGPLRLDLYRPGGDADSNASPQRAAVVLLAGDRWRAVERGELAPYALDLAERGYVCVVPEYRGSDAAAFPAQLQDVIAAIRWVQAASDAIDVDPDRIGAFGHDAGAHLAVLAALTTEADAAGGDQGRSRPAPATDALAAVVGVGGTYALEHEPERPDLNAFLGGDRESKPDVWNRASPSTYLDERGRGGALGDAPPILLLHGEDDDVAPAMASELFHDLLEERDLPAECVVASGAGHDVHETHREFTFGWAEGFFDRHLR